MISKNDNSSGKLNLDNLEDSLHQQRTRKLKKKEWSALNTWKY